MAEQMPQGPNPEQEKMQAELEALQQQLGQHMEVLQNEASPAPEKLMAVKKILELLAKIKALIGDEAFYQNEQLAQLEAQMQEALPQLEGAAEG
ncbi:MAG TPA: hypothetical protein V6C96_03215 [Vampirovibrionales bacterium]